MASNFINNGGKLILMWYVKLTHSADVLTLLTEPQL